MISAAGSASGGASAMRTAPSRSISSLPNSTSRLSAKCRKKVRVVSPARWVICGTVVAAKPCSVNNCRAARSKPLACGTVGTALAGSLLHGLPGVPGGGRYSGRRYAGGRLMAAPFGGDPARLALPDGTQVTTVGAPLGELLAAQRASGAPEVIAATSELLSSPAQASPRPAQSPTSASWPPLRTLTR